MNNTYIIIISYEPNNKIPKNIFKYILDDTGLSNDDFVNTQEKSGKWVLYLRNKEDLFLQKINIIVDKLKEFYDNGDIRYTE
jgi:hypothetical protein